MSERKELTPNSADAVVVRGGDHRMQPRAGAGRAISVGDGISSGCVEVYVRCCVFLLKRTPAVAVRERKAGASSGRLSAAGAVKECESGFEAADSSGAKRFACCSGAMMLLRVVRCDAMRGGCERCGGDDCECCCDAARVEVVVGECDFDVEGCPLGTGPLRVPGPTGPPSLFSLRSCTREHNGPAART